MLLHLVEIGVDGQTDGTGLLQSSLQRRPALYYQTLQVGQDITTLGWLYFTDSTSPCAVSTYQVNVYTQNEINTEFQRDLVTFVTIQTTEKTTTIDSHFLRENATFFQISAVNNCGTSAYYYDLTIG